EPASRRIRLAVAAAPSGRTADGARTGQRTDPVFFLPYLHPPGTSPRQRRRHRLLLPIRPSHRALCSVATKAPRRFHIPARRIFTGCALEEAWGACPPR